MFISQSKWTALLETVAEAGCAHAGTLDTQEMSENSVSPRNNVYCFMWLSWGNMNKSLFIQEGHWQQTKEVTPSISKSMGEES